MLNIWGTYNRAACLVSFVEYYIWFALQTVGSVCFCKPNFPVMFRANSTQGEQDSLPDENQNPIPHV